MSNAPKISIKPTESSVSAKEISRKRKEINGLIDLHNDANHKKLTKQIRGAFHTAINKYINDYFKVIVATNGKIGDEVITETCPAMLADHIKQKTGATARHIQRLVLMGLLVPVAQEPKIKHWNSVYRINIDFMSNPPSEATPTPPKPDEPRELTPQEFEALLRQPADTSENQAQMQVVHREELPTMKVIHKRCEQLEKQPKNSPKTENLQHTQKQPNTLTYSNLTSCCKKNSPPNWGIYLIVKGFYRVKDNYKGCGYVDKLSTKSDFHVFEVNKVKKTIKTAFDNSLAIGGTFKNFHWGGAGGAAAA